MLVTSCDSDTGCEIIVSTRKVIAALLTLHIRHHYSLSRDQYSAVWYEYPPDKVVWPCVQPRSHQSDRIILHWGHHLMPSPGSLWTCGSASGVPARDALAVPPSGWRRPPGRPSQTWLHQIGDGTLQSDVDIPREPRSALRAFAAPAFWTSGDDDNAVVNNYMVHGVGWLGGVMIMASDLMASNRAACD